MGSRLTSTCTHPTLTLLLSAVAPNSRRRSQQCCGPDRSFRDVKQKNLLFRLLSRHSGTPGASERMVVKHSHGTGDKGAPKDGPTAVRSGWCKTW